MYKIVEARTVGLNIKQFVIEAPRIARKQRPGQFVILRLHEKGERIPLTIKSSDPAAGTVTIVVQSVGKTTTPSENTGRGLVADKQRWPPFFARRSPLPSPQSPPSPRPLDTAQPGCGPAARTDTPQ